jgi:plasmid stability protein
MSQLVVRNLEEGVKARLRRRAQRHRRSMEEEVREILRSAVGAEREGAPRLGSRLRDRFAGLGWEGDLGALRGGEPRAAAFRR